MMAPLCVACRRTPGPVLSSFVLCCLIFYLTQCASSVLIYDRLTLLSLQTSTNDLIYQARNGSSHSSPFLTSIPGYLRRWPCSLPVRRRRRKRGRWGGFAVKLKHFLAQQQQLESGRSFLGFHVKGLVGDFSIRWRSLDPVYQWNKNTSMTMAEAAPLPAYGSPRFHRAGVCVSNLQRFRSRLKIYLV